MNNIDSSIDNVDSKTCRIVLKQLLNNYMAPAFSALPKKEFDLAIFKALEQLNYVSNSPTLYELIQKLRITRSKARNLLYDRELRRSNIEQLNLKVKEVLKTPLIQKQGNLFVLEIDNPLLLDHLKAKLQDLGYASDGSFSPSLVKLTLDAISALILDCISGEKHEEIRRILIKAGAPDTTFKGVLKSTLKQIGKKIAQDTGESLGDSISEYFGPIVDGITDKISSVSTSLFKNNEKIMK